METHLKKNPGASLPLIYPLVVYTGQTPWQEALQQGLQQGEAAILTRLLKHRFKQIPESYLKQIEQADAETLLLLGEKILDANVLEEVFE